MSDKAKVVAEQAERRYSHDQALASAKIEGYVPTPEFLADSEAVIAGTMTTEQAIARSLERAREVERASQGKVPSAA